MIVGFGVGIGALVTNVVVAVAVYFVLVDAGPVVSGEWHALWVAVICPYLTAPLAVLVTWKICVEKERGKQALGGEAATICRDGTEHPRPRYF